MPLTYNAATNKLEIDQETLALVADELLYAMRNIRELAGLPLDKYKNDMILGPSDFAQRGIISAANFIGINLGAKRGNEIDLRE